MKSLIGEPSKKCAGQSAMLLRCPPPRLVLRGRQSLERVHARLLAEDLS
ncbi:hypothetical protein [Nocardia terpenica]|uniref:Uncharacterized protein n=1 Tax=Nocardia terpenica TaxID=455432 RepID=A0A6G9ZCU9_9NOCA|nr:hypothetical protein [Nocardia terpenica]QIS23274.1 hypothetical protein F6W96_38010 [Nocardia terpenica]